MGIQQLAIFLFCPFTFVNAWIQVIVPPFPTLLAETAVEFLGNLAPFLGAVFLHKFGDDGVFFRSPGTLDESGT